MQFVDQELFYKALHLLGFGGFYRQISVKEKPGLRLKRVVQRERRAGCETDGSEEDHFSGLRGAQLVKPLP